MYNVFIKYILPIWSQEKERSKVGRIGRFGEMERIKYVLCVLKKGNLWMQETRVHLATDSDGSL